MASTIGAIVATNFGTASHISATGYGPGHTNTDSTVTFTTNEPFRLFVDVLDQGERLRPGDGNHRLQWRNVSAAGGFSTLRANAGDDLYLAADSPDILTNNSTISAANRVFPSGGESAGSYVAGLKQFETDADGTLDVGGEVRENFSEGAWSININASVTAGDTYEFRVTAEGKNDSWGGAGVLVPLRFEKTPTVVITPRFFTGSIDSEATTQGLQGIGLGVLASSTAVAELAGKLSQSFAVSSTSEAEARTSSTFSTTIAVSATSESVAKSSTALGLAKQVSASSVSESTTQTLFVLQKVYNFTNLKFWV